MVLTQESCSPSEFASSLKVSRAPARESTNSTVDYTTNIHTTSDDDSASYALHVIPNIHGGPVDNARVDQSTIHWDSGSYATGSSQSRPVIQPTTYRGSSRRHTVIQPTAHCVSLTILCRLHTSVNQLRTGFQPITHGGQSTGHQGFSRLLNPFSSYGKTNRHWETVDYAIEFRPTTHL